MTNQTWKQFNFLQLLYIHLIRYPTAKNLSYFWNFGFMSGIFLASQIITGIFLAMHYVPESTQAFDSVESIMRDVNYGWLYRYLHLNGASFFFIILYIHMSRSFLFRSYEDHVFTWISGLVIFLLVMATAFVGYVLPYGQMSYWGATVITNLFSAIPLLGQNLVEVIWGGFSVGNPTLIRFFVIHFLLPFVILIFVILHLMFLHNIGSTNPSKSLHFKSYKLYISFYPNFIVKDVFSLAICIALIFLFITYAPNYLGHPDNYIKANFMNTPEHIVPEWYFLPFYGILRSIPNKIGGILFMFGSIVILFFLPYFGKIKYSALKIKDATIKLKKLFRFSTISLSLWGSIFLILGWLGSQPVEDPFTILGLIFTLLYFILLPNILEWLIGIMLSSKMNFRRKYEILSEISKY